jgi:hypothetical protein
MHHARPVCSEQCQKDLRLDFLLKRAVPKTKTFFLDGGEMGKSRKQERIEVFRVIRPRNKTANEDVLLLVSSVRRKVEEHPDIDPASRSFLGIELSTVY